jgi:hypothetical protein
MNILVKNYLEVAVFPICDILTRIRIRGSVPLVYGLEPHPALFFSGFQDSNIKKFLPPVVFIFNYYYIYDSLQRLKVIKKS